ncbi:MAG TPA: OB-fold domain-containing protein [Acidimicrobiia bacterium]|nr:OB-fold domain-containing protein [Acidimicrobiia bacterium]
MDATDASALDDETLLARFAGTPIDRDTAPYYRARLARRLALARCGACGRWHHPPRPICPDCWSTDVRPTPVAGTGTIHLATFLHQGPPAEGVDYSTPYPVVTVELDEQAGLRFTSTVVGAPGNDAIRIGRRVELDWIERGGTPLPVFRLTDAEAAAA